MGIGKSYGYHSWNNYHVSFNQQRIRKWRFSSIYVWTYKIYLFLLQLRTMTTVVMNTWMMMMNIIINNQAITQCIEPEEDNVTAHVSPHHKSSLTSHILVLITLICKENDAADRQLAVGQDQEYRWRRPIWYTLWGHPQT